jgi:hypothetical protein
VSHHWKAYHLNRMIQDALADPPLFGQLFENPEPVYARYNLSEAEKQVFRQPSRPALRALGIHPILAMIFMIPREPGTEVHMSIAPEHLKRLQEIF